MNRHPFIPVVLCVCCLLAGAAWNHLPKWAGYERFSPSRADWLCVKLNATLKHTHTPTTGFGLCFQWKVSGESRQPRLTMVVNHVPNSNLEALHALADMTRDAAYRTAREMGEDIEWVGDIETEYSVILHTEQYACSR